MATKAEFETKGAVKAGNLVAHKWDMAENKVLEGVYEGKEDSVGAYGQTLYSVRLVSGEIAKFWDKSVLRTALKEVPVGSEVRIEYLGEEPSPTQKDETTGQPATYSNFEVLYIAPEAQS